jgi:FMN phosphatase YigB (HAD superfamily)
MRVFKKSPIKKYSIRINSIKANKETSVMIGDSLEAIQGALDFGMEAIYFNEHKKKYQNQSNNNLTN